MAARAAIVVLSLAALACASSARAEDDPSCARYNDAMSYNLCLASHGPKANNLGSHRGSGPARAGWDGATHSRAPARFSRWRGPRRAHRRMHMEFQVR